MSKTLPPLPHFENPPVVEVAISVQFHPLVNLRTGHLGLLWNQFRDRFPKIQEQPPLSQIIEGFGPATSPKLNVEMRVGVAAGSALGATANPGWPVSRCQFLTELEDQVIQVQADRILFNWRKIEGAGEYPRYSKMSALFKDTFEKFREFLERERLGSLAPNQCEITYVNRIVSGVGWERPGQIGEVLPICEPRYSDEFLPEPEGLSFQARYVIPAASGEPLGRLHISAQPVTSGDGSTFLMLQLTARGRPEGEGLKGALRFLDIGHEWVLRSFVSMTSARMHAIWGIRRDS
jgi:uncharacterized protein (TIGR04255 family)